MLRPQDGPTREIRRLDGVWRFGVESDVSGRMPVPSSYNDVLPGSGLRTHVGDVWYERDVWIPTAWGSAPSLDWPTGRRILLRFDAAAHEASVWVNGSLVAEHTGGYLPFEADVTHAVVPGEEAIVRVRVGNVLTLDTIPPGVVEETATGRRQRYFHDFFHYSGLHRSVWLSCVPTTRVESVRVRTELDPLRANGMRDGVVRLALDVCAPEGTGEVSVTAIVRDAVGNQVASGAAARADDEIELRIPDVHVWAPGDGYRYQVTLEVRDDAGRRLDHYRLPVGVRTVRVEGTRLLVNDEPVRLRGFGRHEDQIVRGKGHDDVLAVHDHALLAWFGANSFRTSHYPYAEEVLDLADEDGVLVIDEAPAVGQNHAFAGGRLAPGAFGDGPGLIGETAQAAHAQVLRELVARDAHHPSVIAWSVANEPASASAAAEAYFAPLFALVRELDPTRPVTFANEGQNPAAACRVSQLADLLLLNRYFGWYVDNADLDSAEIHLRTELESWAALGKPIVVSEYGADAMVGVHHTDPEPWSEEYQASVLEMSGRVFDSVPAVIGEHVWNFADFATAPGLIRVDGNRKGVLTRDRRPKAAAWTLRERWHGESERSRGESRGE